jgi:tripartite-type tricarboxylate transporter receptor subunit TctC
MPASRLQTLRDALDKVMADPEFMENMTEIERPVNYLTGAATADLLANIMLNESQIKPLVLEIAQGSK